MNELPKKSVTIIEAVSVLAQIADENYRTVLSAQKIEFLCNEIKPLFRTLSQLDFKAMCFNKDVLALSLILLNEQQDQFDTSKDGIIAQISELPLAVPMVAKEQALIKNAQQNHYWSNCSDVILDDLAVKLAPLEKIEKRDLIQSSFTVIHPQGIRGVFNPREIDEILKLTDKLAA